MMQGFPPMGMQGPCGFPPFGGCGGGGGGGGPNFGGGGGSRSGDPLASFDAMGRELCGDFKRGDCRRGDRCRYSHGDGGGMSPMGMGQHHPGMCPMGMGMGPMGMMRPPPNMGGYGGMGPGGPWTQFGGAHPVKTDASPAKGGGHLQTDDGLPPINYDDL